MKCGLDFREITFPDAAGRDTARKMIDRQIGDLVDGVGRSNLSSGFIIYFKS